MKIKLCLLIFILLGVFTKNNQVKYLKEQNHQDLAIIIDGEESSSIPAKGNYNVKTYCEGGDAYWNYNTWELIIKIQEPVTKCTLSFTSTNPVLLSDHIISLKNEEGIFNEPVTDYRYQGKKPNNYLLFNNELWRIIGVFKDNTHNMPNQNLVKIIRKDSIGSLVLSNTANNDWSISILYNLLNNYYYNGINEEELNYCYQWDITVPGNCNFKLNGILDNNSRNMIENVTWRIGGIETLLIPNLLDIYNAERGTLVFEDRTTEIEGYIGLMYPSDYGYSVETSSCSRDTSLGEYGTVDCSGSSWLSGKSYEWLLTPDSYNFDNSFRVDDDGRIDSAKTNLGYSVRPTVYLKQNIKKIAGDGRIDNPYIITSG